MYFGGMTLEDLEKEYINKEKDETYFKLQAKRKTAQEANKANER